MDNVNIIINNLKEKIERIKRIETSNEQLEVLNNEINNLIKLNNYGKIKDVADQAQAIKESIEKEKQDLQIDNDTNIKEEIKKLEEEIKKQENELKKNEIENRKKELEERKQQSSIKYNNALNEAKRQYEEAIKKAQEEQEMELSIIKDEEKKLEQEINRLFGENLGNHQSIDLNEDIKKDNTYTENDTKENQIQPNEQSPKTQSVSEGSERINIDNPLLHDPDYNKRESNSLYGFLEQFAVPESRQKQQTTGSTRQDENANNSRKENKEDEKNHDFDDIFGIFGIFDSLTQSSSNSSTKEKDTNENQLQQNGQSPKTQSGLEGSEGIKIDNPLIDNPLLNDPLLNDSNSDDQKSNLRYADNPLFDTSEKKQGQNEASPRFTEQVGRPRNTNRNTYANSEQVPSLEDIERFENRTNRENESYNHQEDSIINIMRQGSQNISDSKNIFSKIKRKVKPSEDLRQRSEAFNEMQMYKEQMERSEGKSRGGR